MNIKKDVKVQEAFIIQMNMYSPCACGSGKKFKFCCFRRKHELCPTGK